MTRNTHYENNPTNWDSTGGKLSSVECKKCGGALLKTDRVNNDDGTWKYYTRCENHKADNKDGECLNAPIVHFDETGEVTGINGGGIIKDD